MSNESPATGNMVPTGWQPIETAPKDFVTEFDGWNGERVPNVIWAHPEGAPKGTYCWCVSEYVQHHGWILEEVKGLTHWMPLPPAPGESPAPAVEMEAQFTDTSRAALLWVLWHHQGGSSPVGQPLRFALGMGAHDPLSDHQIAEAKRWASMSGSTTAEFHAAPVDHSALLRMAGEALEQLVAIFDHPTRSVTYKDADRARTTIAAIRAATGGV